MLVIPQSTTASLGLSEPGPWAGELHIPFALRLQLCQEELEAEPPTHHVNPQPKAHCHIAPRAQKLHGQDLLGRHF